VAVCAHPVQVIDNQIYIQIGAGENEQEQ
jgi:hypothetical protein